MLEDYHNKVFILVLYHFLNLRHIVAPSLNSILLNDSMFGFPSSPEKASEGLLKLNYLCIVPLVHLLNIWIFFIVVKRTWKQISKCWVSWLNISWAFLVHKLKQSVFSTLKVWSQASGDVNLVYKTINMLIMIEKN
jgi:hypothetical protein